MRPLRLTLKGFTSFKDEVEVNLAELDMFVISGATGAGKSSLLEAMTYALYGQVPRTNDQRLKELISHGRDRMSVVLDFQVRAQKYRVSRTRRRGQGATQVQLEMLNGAGASALADQVRPVKEHIQRLLGLGFEAFTQAAILPQGRFADFLKSEPRKRREMLNELLRLSVYERMRGLAANEETKRSNAKAGLERRLEEDFADATPARFAELKRQDQALQQLVEESSRRLADSTQRLTALRYDHEKTRELTSKQTELDSLRKRQPEIDAKGRQVEAGHRAARVIPLLDQADRARQEQEKRARERAQAEAHFRAMETHHSQAADALRVAQAAAASLPALREQQRKLDEIAGKIVHRDDIEKRLRNYSEALGKLSDQRREQAARSAALDREIVVLDEQWARARAEVWAASYDPKAHQALEAVRDDATRLQAERARVALEARKTVQKEQDAEAAEAAAAVAEAKDAEAARAKKRAEHALNAARNALRDAQDAHAAAHLRDGLALGKPCPVCLHEVDTLPDTAPLPVLVELAAAVTQAERAARSVDEHAKTQANAAATARAKAIAAHTTAAEARNAWNALETAVTAIEGRLANAAGALVSGDPGEPIELRILAALDAMRVRSQTHAQAETRVATVEQTLALKRQDAENARRESGTLATRVAEGEEHIRQLETTLEQLRGEIRSVTASDDPNAERAEIAARINGLEVALERAREAESKAAQERERARAQVESSRQLDAEATKQAEGLALQAADAISQNAFPDAAAARVAALAPERLERLHAEIDEHHQRLLALQPRVEELLQELDGRRVSDKELARTEKEHAQVQEQHQSARDEHVSVVHKLTELEAKIARAEGLRAELDTHRRQHGLYRRLAKDLQSNQFQSYLLEECLSELVRGASRQLGRLATERYGLDYVDDQIVVIDRDNAGERRGTDTLSGGETFLASLAMALELSDQVQRAVGAIQLDCLFIDEGFGTLDPETLRVVADSVRSLRAGGRMVGIITHIPELREEFDQRLIVAKDAGTSRVRLEEG